MASKQLNQMAELYASIKERASKPDLDLATIRDIAENCVRPVDRIYSPGGSALMMEQP